MKRLKYRVKQAKIDNFGICGYCHQQTRNNHLKSVVISDLLIMLCRKCFAYLEPVNRDR